MRRLLTAVTVAMLPLSALAALPSAASAIEPIVISGHAQSSTATTLQYVQFCQPARRHLCLGATVVPIAGGFRQQLTPGEYRVEFYVTHGGEATVLTQTMTLTESADWSMQLPELVSVDLTARRPNGSALADARVLFRGGTRSDDVTLSPDLPNFESTSYYDDLTTDANGRASMLAFPDSRFRLNVRGIIQDEWARLPLDTPSKTWVDAHADVAVTARALPMRTITMTIDDAAGLGVPGVTSIKSRWAERYQRTFLADDTVSFTFPEGPAVLHLGNLGPLPGFPDAWQIEQPVRVNGDLSLRLTLPDPVEVPVTVKDADTSGVVEGAVVEIGGPADAAALGQGLAPARVFNGRNVPLNATTDADGVASFDVFPDTELTVNSELVGRGVYRTSPEQQVDARADVAVTARLPKSVTTTMKLTDEGGDPSSGEASLILSQWRSVIFSGNGSDTGVSSMTTNPGPVDLFVRAGNWTTVERSLVITEDTVLTTQLPETHDLTVVMIAPGGGHSIEDFTVSGTTSVDTESGPVDAQFGGGGSASPNGMTTLSVPPMTDANIVSKDLYAKVKNLDTRSDRTVVVEGDQVYDGAGAPYVLFDRVDPFILEDRDSLAWSGIDADRATFNRRVQTPFGGDDTSLPWDIANPEQGRVRIDYDKGATICVGATASRADIEGPTGMYACRTRPLDDRALFASDGWSRIESGGAYGGSYRRTAEQGARLSLGSLDVDVYSPPYGGISLVAMTAPNAGAVRLQMHGEWIGERVSLEGPSTDEPTLVPVTFPWQYFSMQGKLHVVVVSDGKPVRVDGIGIAALTFPALPSR